MHAPQISCCFSGYRPGKLPWGNDENDPRCRALKVRLRDVMEAAYDEGYRHFICGMAQGCDLYFCELALQLRGERPPSPAARRRTAGARRSAAAGAA